MRNIKILLLIALVIMSSVTPAFASDDIEVTIDGSKIAFDTEPELSGETVMVPMKEFFEAMGASVYWIESSRLVVAYKDNTHLKLQIDSDLAYINGKKSMLRTAPYISNGHTLIPLKIIAETFSMKPEWNEDTKTLSLEGSGSDAGLKMIDGSVYKTKPINDLGISISIPYHWENLDGPFQYGYQDDFESYSVTLMSQPIDKDITLEELVDNNKALLLDAYDENITFTGEEEIKIDDLLDVKKLYITTTQNETKQKQVLYILKQDDTAYFMTSHYGEEVPEEDIIEVFDNVISTFKIRNLSVDSEEEHYMEFLDFYKAGIQLNQEFYSNMVVEKSEIPFSGTLAEGHGLDAFKIRVTSDQDALEFIIPIAGNAFDGTIYTPFGLGKHNIFITGLPVDQTSGTGGESVEVITNEDEDTSEDNRDHTTDEINLPDTEDESGSDDNSSSDSNIDEPPVSGSASEDNSTDKTITESESSSGSDMSTTDALTTQTEDSTDDNGVIIQDQDETDASTQTSDRLADELTDSTPSEDNTENDSEDESDSELDSKNTTDPDTDSKPEAKDEDFDPIDEVISTSSPSQDISEDTSSTLPLMQFSVINVDSRTMRFRIPTDVINSDDVQVSSTSMLITYQVSNEYMKARELYYWMLDNIDIDHESEMKRNNIQVFDDAVGSPEEINQLYVAYLRAIDIPARVMKGTTSDETYYWTELFLNGSWVVSDLIEGILLKDDDAVQHAQSTLFNVNMDLHRLKYDFKQVMPY